MTVTVGLVAAFSYFVLGLPIGAGVLLGAVLAPTDPVLATDVQIRHAGDKDQLRFLLTSEAGMNDGSAFPFVMLGLGLLGLHEIGPFGLKWLAVDVLWATIGAVLIGIVCGMAVAKVGWMLRSGEEKFEMLDDLVGLGLIAVAYGVCLWANAWGFLAVFFAGVALRHTELILAGAPKDRQGFLEDDMNKSEAAATSPDHTPPLTVSSEALVFKEHLERLSELTLVLLIGGMVYLGEWSWRAAGMALFLFMVARPVSVFVGLLGSGVPLKVKAISGWFGVRGIGSVYYLMYAIQHGLQEPIAVELTQITLTVVMLSIFIHGATVKPIMERFWVSK
jgi:NhaP-type Na+/H+ or K+/H+ antiporter